MGTGFPIPISNFLVPLLLPLLPKPLTKRSKSVDDLPQHIKIQRDDHDDRHAPQYGEVYPERVIITAEEFFARREEMRVAEIRLIRLKENRVGALDENAVLLD